MKPQQQRKRKKVSGNLAQPMKASSKMTSKSECMSNSVVLRSILSNLTASDLVNCRRVNKLWYSEANLVMRRSNIALKISSECLLDQVTQLTDLIPNMKLPFNGLSFRKFPCPQNTEDSGNGNPHELLQVLPPITHLHMDDSSASEELILRILESNANHLEILSFESAGKNLPPQILRAIFQLKKLKRINGTTNLREYEDQNQRHLRTMIKNCESLESVEGIFFHYFQGIPESRWHVIKNFLFCIYLERLDWMPLEKYLEVVPPHQRLTSLIIKSWHSSRQDKQMFVNLAHSCKETLTSLRADFGKLNFKSFYDLCVEGSKLRNLTIIGHARSRDGFESELIGINPEEVQLLRAMNLTVSQLRKLQIVPVRPALHHLTGLKDLTIEAFQFREEPLMFEWDNKRARRRVASKILQTLSLERMRNARLNF